MNGENKTGVCVSLLGSERANQSLQQLSSTLERLSPDAEEAAAELRVSDGSFFTTFSTEEDRAAWSQKTQSEAGDSAVRLS